MSWLLRHKGMIQSASTVRQARGHLLGNTASLTFIQYQIIPTQAQKWEWLSKMSSSPKNYRRN